MEPPSARLSMSIALCFAEVGPDDETVKQALADA